MEFVEAHGIRIPQIGLGTMTLKGDVCVQAVKTALQLGYRHLDTAAYYENEKENGEGLRQSGIKREEVLICTKVRQGDLMPEDFARVVDQSLMNLQLPYVDLLLIHWNNPDIPFKLSVGALCKAKKDGFARHVGVANFTTSMLDEAWAVTSEPLVCNQIEMHPFINQDKVLAACKKHGMAVVAYCPIARGKVPGADALERIGKAHGKSAAQVSLRYLVQRGVCAIPRTATPAHLKQNLEVFDFKLSDAEMAELKELNATNMRVVNPPHAPKWDAAVMRAALALVCVVMLAASRAPAQTSRTLRLSQRSNDCIKRQAPSSPGARACIGAIAEPCLERRRTRSTADQVNACIDREQAVWDDILNRPIRPRRKLDEDQKLKLRDMQRAWIASRDKTCGFLLGLLPGHMAVPMSVACENAGNRHDARCFCSSSLTTREGK